MEPKSALGNVMSKVGDPAVKPLQPGERTDTLLSSLKALQSYAKMTGEINPEDEDLKLVRKMIIDLSNLLKKDQMEEKNGKHIMPDGSEMSDEEMMGPTPNQPDMFADAPQMPDLSSMMKLGQ